jgi:hypothetical protein
VQPPLRSAGNAADPAALRDLERLTQKLVEWHLEKRLKSYAALKEALRGS